MYFPDHYKESIRKLVQDHGQPIEFDSDGYGGQEVSIYGWGAYKPSEHILEDNCTWIIRPEATLKEKTYSQFTSTEEDTDEQVGINISPVDCACGKHKDITLRYSSSLEDALKRLFPEADIEDEGIPI